MPVVVALEDFRPSPRYDGEPWTDAQIYEGTASDAVFTLLETQALTPVDADPENPAYRNFTTQLGTAEELWYQIVFIDADMSTGQPTAPIQNVADEQTRLRLGGRTRAVAQGLSDPAAQRADASPEVSGRRDRPRDRNRGHQRHGRFPTPTLRPSCARSTSSERWSTGSRSSRRSGSSAWGTRHRCTPRRDSWDRHKHKLASSKAAWGIA